ncbi:MAG: LptF/LptG family permease [Spirochaetales bacterium]
MTLLLYITKRFVSVFMGSLAFFTFAVVLVDFLTNLWQYILENTSSLDIFTISFLYIPKAMFFAAPLAILFSAAFTLSNLYANNELIAVFSSGISLFRFTLPILVFSLIASIGFFFFEDLVVVPNYKKMVDLKKTALNQTVSYDNNRVVVLSDGGLSVYRADTYNDTTKQLFNLYIFLRHPDKTLDKIIYAQSAQWDGSRWNFVNPITYTHVNDSIVYTTGSDYVSTENPDIFRNVSISIEEVSVEQAAEYIQKLKITGLPYADASAQYYKKFSYPFIIFIAVFLSIGLSGKSKKNVLLVSLASCVFASVLFYVLQMLTMLMAKFGYLSPLSGAWLPVIVFIGISIVLLRFAKT